MIRRRSLREIRKFNRKFPAPPPTPKGKVYATKNGKTELASARELHLFCKKTLDEFDSLSPADRERVRRTDKMPDPVNKTPGFVSDAMAALGIALG